MLINLDHNEVLTQKQYCCDRKQRQTYGLFIYDEDTPSQLQNFEKGLHILDLQVQAGII